MNLIFQRQSRRPDHFQQILLVGYDSQNGINGFVVDVSVVVHSCIYYTFYHEQFTGHIKTLVLQTINITNFSNTVLTVQGGNL